MSSKKPETLTGIETSRHFLQTTPSSVPKSLKPLQGLKLPYYPEPFQENSVPKSLKPLQGLKPFMPAMTAEAIAVPKSLKPLQGLKLHPTDIR